MNYFKLVFSCLILVFFGKPSYSQSISSLEHGDEDSFLNHLLEVNEEWKHHSENCPTGVASFETDLDRIELHLNLVAKSLRSNPPSNLNLEQSRNRLFLIQKLENYANNRVFPINKYHPVRQPYFVDEHGTNCAVGQLIVESGNTGLVSLISKEHNYDYIVDIETVGLTEWADKYGFTLEELKWIQPTYPPTTSIDPVLGGANGPVSEMVYNPYDGSVLIGGSFTELNNYPCLNVGFYKDNQLNCFGNGVDGVVHDLVVQSGEVYCFGELQNNGITYPLAKFDGASWTYISIPSRNEATCTAANNGGAGYQIEVAINHSSFSGKQEIWHLLNDGNWERKAEVNGIILDIIASGHGRVHAGHFDTVSVFNSSGMVDSMFSVHNVVIKQNYSPIWFGIGSEISDTVNVVKSIGGGLIFGGTCGSQPGESNICLSRYLNGSLQTLCYSPFGEQWSINTMAYNNGSTLMLGGVFDIIPLVGTQGNNLASYHLVYNTLGAMANLDGSVNGLAYQGADLYIGGHFNMNMTVNLNHLGRIISTASIKEPISESDLNVYPNPFNSVINIEGVDDGLAFSILNMNGQEIISGLVNDKKILGLERLASGTYLFHIETSKGLVVKKITKQ